MLFKKGRNIFVMVTVAFVCVITSLVAFGSNSDFAFNKDFIRMWTGDEELLVITLPENITDRSIEWNSSDKKVATVIGGKVKAVSKGSCIISATNSLNQTIQCNVNVHQNAEVKEFKIWETKYGSQMLDWKQTWQKAHILDISWSPVICNFGYIEDYDIFSVVNFRIVSNDGEVITATLYPMWTSQTSTVYDVLKEQVKTGKEYTITATLSLIYKEKDKYITVNKYESNTLIINKPDCNTYGMSFEDVYLAEEATCASYAKYYKNCSVCGVNYSEVVSHGEKDSNNHVLLYLVNYSEKEHFQTCGCGEKSVLTTHSFDVENANEEYKCKEATCEEKASYYKSCICGAKSDVLFEIGTELGHNDKNADNICDRCSVLLSSVEDSEDDNNGNIQHTHSYSVSISKHPTCIVAGIKTYTCSCGDTYTETIKATGKHTGGTATCTEKAKCTVCKQYYGTLKTHTYKSNETKATLKKNGRITEKCKVCGIVNTTTVYYPKSIKLSATTYTYNGKTKTPSVTVKDSKGKTLKKGTDYTVTYPKKRKAIGKYTVTVTFKGNYSGTKKLTFEIVPAKVSLSKLTAGSKQLTATWTTVSGATGYEVTYSTSKKFTKKTTKRVTIKKAKTKKTTIKNLKKGKKYYVKVRAYKSANGKKLYGAYSSVKSIKVK